MQVAGHILCQRLTEASASTCLSAQSVAVELISRDRAESSLFLVVFAIYLLLVVRSSNVIMALCGKRTISNPNFMTLSGIRYDQS